MNQYLHDLIKGRNNEQLFVYHGKDGKYRIEIHKHYDNLKSLGKKPPSIFIYKLRGFSMDSRVDKFESHQFIKAHLYPYNISQCNVKHRYIN